MGKWLDCARCGGEMSLFESHDFAGVELLCHEFSLSHEKSALWRGLLGLLARTVRCPLDRVLRLPSIVHGRPYLFNYRVGGPS